MNNGLTLELIAQWQFTYWMRERQSLLGQVDNIERTLNELRPGTIAPRTAELRKEHKQPERSAE